MSNRFLSSFAFASLILPLAASLPSAARAQDAGTAVILASPSAANSRTNEPVIRSITEGLRERRLAVLSPQDAATRLYGRDEAACTSVDCADDINRILGTSFAILFEVQSTGSRATMVSVALVGLSSDHSVGGQAEVATGRDGLPRAAERAFAMAFDRWQADQQGHLVFESNPTGAFIELDGQTLGRTPLRRLAQAGVHRVRATFELENGQVDTQSRDVTLDRHEEETLSFVPTAVAGPIEDVITQPVTRTDTQSDLRWVNWVVGGALVAGGAALAGYELYVLATAGQCEVTDNAGICRGGTTPFAAENGIALAVGGAMLIGGAAFMVFQPFSGPSTSGPSTTAQPMQVHIGPTGLRLTGTF